VRLRADAQDDRAVVDAGVAGVTHGHLSHPSDHRKRPQGPRGQLDGQFQLLPLQGTDHAIPAQESSGTAERHVWSGWSLWAEIGMSR
jgi:hypothetical protein